MSGALCAMVSGGEAPGIILTPSAANGLGDTEIVQTNIVTASMPSGSGYTFVWSYVSGDESVTAAFGSTGPSQRWFAPLVPGEDKFAEWEVSAYVGEVLVATRPISPFVRRL